MGQRTEIAKIRINRFARSIPKAGLPVSSARKGGGDRIAAKRRSRACKTIFITATDTGVGKTVAGLALALQLKQKGYSVGYFKPVQCGGNDAEYFKLFLELDDPADTINPYFAREAISPHMAFKREKIRFSAEHVMAVYSQLKDRYDILIVEGAGGLMVPLSDSFFVADLIKKMQAQVIVVSRLALGTINHTLLTLKQAQQLGLNVQGVIFSRCDDHEDGIAEQTNPQAIERLSGVKVLGTIPFISQMHPEVILRETRGSFDLDSIWAKKSRSTSKYQQDDKKYLWHPFTQMKDWLNDDPLIIERAEGSYLIDTHGKRYLDGVSSLWVNVHGHRHPIMDQAIKDQLEQLDHSTLLGLSHVPAVKLAKELISIAPKGLSKVFYSDNGSSAVEVALKMAYQYWQNIGRPEKTTLVHLENSYHGDTLGSVSVGGIDLFHQTYRKLMFKTESVFMPDGYRCPKGKKYPEYAFESLERMEKLFKKKASRLAALVVEPMVQGAAGMIVWPRGILGKMAALCHKYDVLFIADEVATGFGRTGKMFACEQENVVPDIMCLAKGLTGGYLPLAATLTNKRIYDGFLADYKDQKTFFHGHTYTGNPLAAAAALANLRIFKKERTLVRLAPKIKYLSKKLAMFYNLAHVGNIRQCGFMVGIELVKERAGKIPYAWEEKIGVQVCRKAREKGVILRPLGNVIVWMPPLSISQQEIDHLAEATYEAIGQITHN